MSNKLDLSDILSEVQMNNLGEYMPAMIRQRDWKKIYSVNEDGVSMNQFLSKVKDTTHTILMFQDSKGYKFGCYCSQEWK